MRGGVRVASWDETLRLGRPELARRGLRPRMAGGAGGFIGAVAMAGSPVPVAGTIVGDFMLALIYPTGAPTTPAGWTLLGQSNNAPFGAAAFQFGQWIWKFATSGDLGAPIPGTIQSGAIATYQGMKNVLANAGNTSGSVVSPNALPPISGPSIVAGWAVADRITDLSVEAVDSPLAIDAAVEGAGGDVNVIFASDPSGGTGITPTLHVANPSNPLYSWGWAVGTDAIAAEGLTFWM